jgi:hypothetical protein
MDWAVIQCLRSSQYKSTLLLKKVLWRAPSTTEVHYWDTRRTIGKRNMVLFKELLS